MGIDTVLAYDRIHNTNYVKDKIDVLENRLLQDYTEPSGMLAVIKNTLFGTIAMDMGMNANINNSFAVSRIYNPIHPALAEKEYVLGKEYIFREENGKILPKNCGWNELADTGNMKKGPGTVLGTGAVAAKELGDFEFAEKLLKIADQEMEHGSQRFPYKNASVTANASIALAYFAERDDLYHLVHTGPDKKALQGPMLETCSYPEVLVAKARSHTGEDLELVLYNGTKPGPQKIGLSRLVPNQSYKMTNENGDFSFVSDQNGCVELEVQLNGRSRLIIEKEN